MDCSSNVHNQFHQVMVLPKAQQEKQGRPQPLNCPRCDSSNTKFCYYNNYSFSQPRYFCKACKRYWTQGGTLRNVPVGGGCRKKQRSSSSSKRTQNHQTLTFNSNHVLSTLPTCNSNDLLTLSFPTFSNNPISHLGVDAHSMSGNINTTTTNNNSNRSNAPSLLDFLRSGMLVNRSNSNNLYHGVGNEAVRNMENGAATSTTATIITTTREAQDGETKDLWRCPWQINGEQSMAGVDSIRESWNGVTGFSWQELVNSSLM